MRKGNNGMKVLGLILIVFLILMCVGSFFSGVVAATAYNPQAAVNYADTWWNGRNPNYHDYSNEWGDCATLQWNSVSNSNADKYLYDMGIATGQLVGYYEPSQTQLDRELHNIEVPNQQPTAIIDSITPDPADQGTDTVSFTGHGTDPDGTVAAYNWSSSIDGPLSTSAAFTKPASELSVGTHAIYFKVQDDDGTWSTEDTEDLTIYHANVAPTAIIDSITPDPAEQGTDTVSFTGHGTDPDGTVEAYNWSSSIDGPLNTSAAFTKQASELSVGTQTIYFKVQDDDGTWSTEDTEDLTIYHANVPPTAIIDSITPDPVEHGMDTVSFSGHGTDTDGTVVAYNWSSSIDGPLSTSAAFTKQASELSVGTHTIYFKVQDNDSAWSTEDTEDLTIYHANVPPTAIIDSITPDPAVQGTDTVSFTGHGTDTDGTVAAYNWSSSIDGQLSTSAAFTKPASELSVGTHTIYFKVQDDDGTWSTEDTEDLTINPANVPPTAIIDSITPDYAEQGTDTVSFSGHGTDTDGAVAAYNWSSSIDGPLSTSAAFTKPASELSVGTHTIYFKVQDNDGAWSTEDTADLTIYLGPELSYSPESHDFCDMRECETDNTTFEIWNSGTDTLTYSLSETCDWLEVHPTNGSSAGEHDTITVGMDTTGLFEGSHTCDITINSNDGSGTFTVMVNVVPCPCGNMSANPTSWSPTLNCSESDNEIFTVSATGGTVKGVTVSKVSGPTWLSVSPTDLGDIASGSNKTFTMTAAPPSETSGDFGYTVRVSNTCGTPSTRDVSGTIHVDCPESSWRYKVCKWTYMVYLDGDNNLEGAAIDDFLEMSLVGSTSDVNIVVQFDRIPYHDSSYGDWTDCKRFHVTYGMTPTAANAIENLGECNMGDPNTLTEFVEWSMTEYPAENYALILWNHGSGWKLSVPWMETKGICWDSTSNDHLTLQETGQALSGKYVELLGNDACLMQMIEVAYQMRSSAGIIVGSEETEPWDGWPYDTILSDLTGTPTMSPSTFGGTIVSRYIEYYPAETLSAMNNGDLPGLATAVDNFAQVLIGKLPGNYNEIEEARTNVQGFYDYDYIDLYHFAELIKSSVPGTESAAQAVMDNVDTVVYANAHGSAYQNAHGLTVYYPKNEWSYWTSYENTDFAINTNWDEFLMRYYEGPSDAVLSLSPQSHNFGDMCEYETDSTTFEIWNSGTGTLTYSLSETCGWVDVHPTSGSSTGEHDTLTIDIDTTGLFEGSHTCDISISSNGGSGTFTVMVNVVSCECDGTATSCGSYPNCVNCNEDDGCYQYGSNGCEERDYYCISNEVGCGYTYSNRHTDYYDGWVYYCSSDTVRRHRLFHNYYCDGGTCTDHTSWVDDQLVENCNDHDGWVDTGNKKWVEVNECQEKERKEQEYRDYYCSGGACTSSVTGTQWLDTENTRNKPDIRQPICPIRFGDVIVGNSRDKTTTIYNDCTAILTVNSITRSSGSSVFTYIGPSTPFDIAAGGSLTITVRFAPTSMGSKSANFIVNSNDPDEDNVPFNVSGDGTPLVGEGTPIAYLKKGSTGEKNHDLFIHTAPTTLLESGALIASDYWSPDGSTVGITAIDINGDGIDEIAYLKRGPSGDLDFNLFIHTAPTTLLEPGALIASDYWSPDGSTVGITAIDINGDGIDEIAYLKRGPSGDLDFNLFIHTAPTTLLEPGALIASDYWSPDGSTVGITAIDIDKIAYLKRGPSGDLDFNLFIHTAPTTLLEPGALIASDYWSPDGSTVGITAIDIDKIAYLKRGPSGDLDFNLFIHTAPTTLLEPGTLIASDYWSPDGQTEDTSALW